MAPSFRSTSPRPMRAAISPSSPTATPSPSRTSSRSRRFSSLNWLSGERITLGFERGHRPMPAPAATKKPAPARQAAPATQPRTQSTAELLVRCLENEGVEYIYGIPGEENIDVMDALLSSSIKFVTCPHEQGAASLPDAYRRPTA